MQQRRNLLLVLGAVVVLVAAFVVLRGSDDDEATVATTTPAATTAPADPAADAPAAGTTPTATTPAATATTPAPPPLPTVEVVGGQPEGGVRDLEFEKGDRVRFRVRSDTDDEVHVHGFDIEKAVGPGRPATFDFKAEFDGRYEIELHGAGTPIAELTIQP
jgi:heme/copper-type cytochrome/quinol oxidase subunit 2